MGQMKMKRKLISDVNPGDTIMVEYRLILVRKIIWLTHSQNVIVNGDVLFDKYDSVDVVVK